MEGICIYKNQLQILKIEKTYIITIYNITNK